MFIGAEAAAFSFFRALILVPTHEGATKKLDAIEARLALREPNAGILRVRQNLQTLRNWRHRNAQEGRCEPGKLLSDLLLSLDLERLFFITQAGMVIDGDVSYVPIARLPYLAESLIGIIRNTKYSLHFGITRPL